MHPPPLRHTLTSFASLMECIGRYVTNLIRCVTTDKRHQKNVNIFSDKVQAMFCERPRDNDGTSRGATSLVPRGHCCGRSPHISDTCKGYYEQ